MSGTRDRPPADKAGERPTCSHPPAPWPMAPSPHAVRATSSPPPLRATPTFFRSFLSFLRHGDLDVTPRHVVIPDPRALAPTNLPAMRVAAGHVCRNTPTAKMNHLPKETYTRVRPPAARHISPACTKTSGSTYPAPTAGSTRPDVAFVTGTSSASLARKVNTKNLGPCLR